jgi:heat shock protein HtpX
MEKREYSRVDFRDQISKNKRNSFFLLLGIFLMIIILGYVITLATNPGYFFIIMIFVSLFSIIYVTVSYYKSDKIALASVGAKPASESQYKDFHRLVEGITIASGLPKPRLYVMPSSQINAFASGRNPENAVVCVTEGALKKLERRELEGVLAHEIGHIGNYDIRYMTLVAVGVGMIAIISQIFLRSLWFRSSSRNDKGKAIFLLIGVILAILAPIVVYFVQMSISRKREYASDASAVQFTRNPQGLIGALKKIEKENLPEKKVSKAVAPLFFANPFKELGSTHPPIEKRIQTLERM